MDRAPETSERGCRYVFSGFELHSCQWELRKAGQSVCLQPKAMDLLLVLLQERHRVVTRAELFGCLWPQQRVTEHSLYHALRLARRALDDRGDSQSFIRTSQRRGYRFVGHAREVPCRSEAPRGLTSPRSGLLGDQTAIDGLDEDLCRHK
jgi:DNA-binding winged helix-turn-helix (wHTH) protein